MILPEIWSVSADAWGNVDIWIPDEFGQWTSIEGVIYPDGTIEAPVLEGER